MKYEIKRAAAFVPNRWAGGTTTELFIHPDCAVCGDRNFDVRISTATVDLDESTFSDFTGYDRHITPLCGEMCLNHNGMCEVTLKPLAADAFDGAYTTTSRGRCVDFNLILRQGAWQGEIFCPGNAETIYEPETEGFTGIYALCDDTEIELFDGSETYREQLAKGDFLTIVRDEGPPEISFIVRNNSEENAVVAARAEKIQ